MPEFSIEPGYTYSANTGSYELSLGKSSIAAPLYDVTLNVTLSSTLTPLSSSLCQLVTIINNTGYTVSASLHSSSMISIPDQSGYTFNSVPNANMISVAGTGILTYVISK